jgi:hypothetical protein
MSSTRQAFPLVAVTAFQDEPGIAAASGPQAFVAFDTFLRLVTRSPSESLAVALKGVRP